jgi:hypothetical protein
LVPRSSPIRRLFVGSAAIKSSRESAGSFAMRGL